MASRVARYNFWAWQYTSRNRVFWEKAQRSIEWIEAMRSEGMISEHYTVDNIAEERHKKMVLMGGPIKSGIIPREPSSDEILYAKELLSYHDEFMVKNYQYEDLFHPPTSMREVVNSLDSYFTKSSFPNKRIQISRWPFRRQRIITDSPDAHELFKTKIVKSLGGRTHLLEIDFNYPLNVIQSEIALIFQTVYGDDPDSYSKAYENCYKQQLKAKGETLGANDSPRITGLWLWDYMRESGQTNVAEAIRTMRQVLGERHGNGSLAILGYSHSEDRTLERHYKKAKACIEACEVLPIK